MKNTILNFSLLTFSVIFLSACTLSSSKKVATPTPTPAQINQETGNESETEILQQLNSTSSSPSFDVEIKNIGTEIAE